MNHLPFTLLAYFFNALSVLTSKFLLTKAIPDPLVYIFYISLFSLVAVFALPFTHTPNLEVFTLSSLSTLLWTTGAYFMYRALKLGSVSRVIPIIGTMIPLILLIVASSNSTISHPQTLAIWLLITGMIFLTIMDWRVRLPDGQGKMSKWEITFEILSAAFFAISYLLLREAYLKLDFFSVLVWSRLILLPFGLVMLAIPNLRRKIITSQGPQINRGTILHSKINFFSKTGVLFLTGQASGALSELLILFSISLANPALVNSLQGTQYIFLLIFALILSKKHPAVFHEKYTVQTLFSKLLGIGLIGIGLYLLAFSGN